MFSKNLKTLRKQKGFSQEELASRLHVVRQTISKWEKNLSVPDADTLIRLAEILEVSVSELLGSKIENENENGNVTNDVACLLYTSISIYQNLLSYLANSNVLAQFSSYNDANAYDQYEYLNYTMDVFLNATYLQHRCV